MENEKKTEASKAPRRSLRNGYLAGLSVLAVALAVAVNLVVGQLHFGHFQGIPCKPYG